ncbi:MAG TPA: sugar phosphate isomerase/epimerase family protein [Candidatus Dormibacteraeota bacterium]|nr:sugar phosphate isomerase/epimerase family protein [Candidatus Dormibacteraeota bacterium]
MSTLTASFADDVRAYAAAGVDGVGIWELKLGDGSLDEFRASGLGSATAVPTVPSVHPLPLLPGPETVRERVESLLRSLEVLAPFQPAAILCFTGPGDRETAIDGVRKVAREAEQLGLRVAVEPFQREGIESWSILNTLGDAAEFVEEVGSPAVGIQFDVWHLWNTPEGLDEISRHAHLIAGVHVNDWREPTRGWADRVLPGDGVAGLPAFLGVLEDVGWKGFYDLEVFSDNGAFGDAYPDSLWDVDAAELARRGRDAFFRCWSERRVPATAAGRRGET